MESSFNISNMILKNDIEIINEIGMANLPFIVYIFSKKYKKKVVFTDIGDDCMISYGKSNIANMSYLATHLHHLNIVNNVLEVYGNTSIPAAYENYCEFKIILNGKEVQFEMFDVGLNQYINGECYELRKAFRLNIDLEMYCNIALEFQIITNGIKSTCNKINSYRFFPVADLLDNQYKVFDKYVVRIIRNRLIVETLRSHSEVLAYEDRFRATLENINTYESFEALKLREKYFKKIYNKSKRICLFFDRFDKANDNGETLFKYVCENKLSCIEPFFVISEDSPDFLRLSKYGNIVSAFSDEHKCLLLMADYIFTSQLNGFVENPFGENCEFYRDLYHNPKVVFLQHGVTKDDQSDCFHRFNHNIYAIIVSSSREKQEFLKRKYGLKAEQILLTGMPRFDELYHNEKKQILIMPTWRKGLMSLKKEKDIPISRWMANDNIENSKYLKKINSLLNSKMLQLITKKYGYRIAFMPHPLSRQFEHLFSVPEWVKVYSVYDNYKDVFAESDLMITDYSSVAFDFAYLRKPIIYYQFDKKKFFATHTYNKGYFDYIKEGFGPVCKYQFKVIYLLKHYLKKECRLKSCFSKKIDTFFDKDISESCKKIIDNIIE